MLKFKTYDCCIILKYKVAGSIPRSVARREWKLPHDRCSSFESIGSSSYVLDASYHTMPTWSRIWIPMGHTQKVYRVLPLVHLSWSRFLTLIIQYPFILPFGHS